jgi:hypothetical protein
MEKISQIVKSVRLKMSTSLVPGMYKWCEPGFVRFFSIFFTLRESLRAPDPALPGVRSSPLRLHPWRLGSEALRLLQHWGKPYQNIQMLPLTSKIMAGVVLLFLIHAGFKGEQDGNN